MKQHQRWPGSIGLILVTSFLVFALLLTACQGDDAADSAEPEAVVAEPVEEEVAEEPPPPTPEPEAIAEVVEEPVVEEATEVPPTEVPPTEVPVTEVPPTEVPAAPPPDQTEFIQAWAGSSMGNTYGLGKGPNTYCSRCHSPQNWDPASAPGPPPTCITCKFPTDDAVRETPFMDFVEEEDWVGIDCDTCHIVMDEYVMEEIVWLNPLTMEYDEVNTPNELCTKCHLTSAGVSATGGRGVTHEIYLGGSAHKNWAGVLTTVRRPEYCSDCHDPHTQVASQCVDCHDQVLSSDDHIKGLNAEHENVSCMACHDAEGFDVGPSADESMGGLWVTQVTSPGRGGGPPTVSGVVSHSPQWLVNCDRCHFEENPWELTVLTAAGTIPDPADAGSSGRP